jgi:hypothetical protein
MRFVNDTTTVLPMWTLGIDVSPGEEFDWPGWDAVKNGPITGCRALEDPSPADDDEDGGGPEGGQDGAGTPDGPEAAPAAAAGPTPVTPAPAPQTTPAVLAGTAKPATAGSEEK